MPAEDPKDNGDTYEQQQKEEWMAVESTYSGQVTVPHNPWNVWKPIECFIDLRPLDSCFLDGDPLKKHDFHITLHLKCPDNYPDRKPFVDLLKPKGLSNEQVEALRLMLRKKADDDEGFPQIIALAETVKTYLADLAPLPAGSFHDHMMANAEKTEAEKKRKRLDTEKKDLEKIEEEMARFAPPKPAPIVTTTCTGTETKKVGNRRIVVLSNIPVNRPLPHPSCHEWFGFFGNEQLLISDWEFRYTANPNDPSKGRNFVSFLEKVDAVAVSINALRGLHALEGLFIGYAFCEVTQESLSPHCFHVTVSVAQKVHTNESNMTNVYELLCPQPILIRTLALQGLSAIRSLHEHRISHMSLSMGSVWMSDSTSSAGFRFSDFGSFGQLLDLMKLFNQICNDKPIVEEDPTDSNGKDRLKQDCFHLGTLLDSLSIMSHTSVYADRPQRPPALSDFIEKCQEKNDIDYLLRHEFMAAAQISEIDEQLFAPFGDRMHPDSRLRSEFIIFRVLGKGGFGDVILARNKIDMSDYAVKRIPLDKNNEKGNRRTTREAKHIAKLNHRNLVRYFNTWVEECIPREESSDEECAVPIPGKEGKKKMQRAKTEEVAKVELGGGDSLLPANLQNLAIATPVSKGAEAEEWSVHFEKKNKSQAKLSKRSTVSEQDEVSTFSGVTEGDEEGKREDGSIDWNQSDDEEYDVEGEGDDDEDDSSDEDDITGESKHSIEEDSVFGRAKSAEDDDDDIVFVGSSTHEKIQNEQAEEECEKSAKAVERRVKEIVAEHQNPRMLCIQMEYCDKSTLRHFIDGNNLITNQTEAWRIFAEILSGLQYIHESRIIHRDIKPLNIFLTSQNEVKIGDFGLATIVPVNPRKKKVPLGTDKSNSNEAILSPKPPSKSKEVQQTKDVGTQLYMAPELFGETSSNDDYDFKVDIYSAGVVLFEMFYKPLPIGMERVSKLNALRDNLEIPADFGEFSPAVPGMKELLTKLVKRMMSRNPDERPSAEGLLNDDDLPLHTKEEDFFMEMFSKTLKKRDGRMNMWLRSQQFSEEVPMAVNYRYDVKLCTEKKETHNREAIVETIRADFCQILKVHAFEKVHTHTLIPVSTALAAASVRTKPVEFLDTNGIPVALPMDLRQNFVRFCVRGSIQRLKRFNFGRVYSQGEPNLHPKEKWECCVDCIGPQSTSVSLEAELLLVACEMVTSALPNSKFVLKIGHSLLLEAQIRHLKLPDNVRSDLLDALHMISVSEKPLSPREKASQLAKKIDSKAANVLVKTMSLTDSVFGQFKDKVMSFRKKLSTPESNQLVSKAIKDLDDIQKTFFFCRGEKFQKITVVFDSQVCYRPSTFADGLVFQIQAETHVNKKSKVQTVLAGGRYDSALLRERHPRDVAFEVPQSIVGFGVDIDMLASIREHLNDHPPPANSQPNATTNKLPVQRKVLICSKEIQGGGNLLQEKFRLARELWNMNIPADVFHNPVANLDSLADHRSRSSISHVVALTNSNLEALILTGSGTTDKTEKVDFTNIIPKICETQPQGQLGHKTPNGPVASSSTTVENGHDDHMTPVSASRASRSGSTTQMSSGLRGSSATVNQINVIFAIAGDRFHKNIKDKKRVDNQITNQLTDFVTQFSGKCKIEVIVVDVSIDIIKRIVGDITRTSTLSEIATVFDSLAHQSRQDLVPLKKQLQSTIHGSSSAFEVPRIVILYRNADNFFRCLT